MAVAGLSFNEVVDLADDVALEASDDVALGPAFGGPSSHVSSCRLGVVHPDNDGAVNRGVELAVPSMVNPVSATGLPRASGDRTDAGEFHKICL